MKHARPDYDRFQDPEGLIPEDEPVFLIRGQDVTAPLVLEFWASVAQAKGAKPNIIAVVREHAEDMRRWQDNHCKVPDMPEEIIQAG